MAYKIEVRTNVLNSLPTMKRSGVAMSEMLDVITEKRHKQAPILPVVVLCLFVVQEQQSLLT